MPDSFSLFAHRQMTLIIRRFLRLAFTAVVQEKQSQLQILFNFCISVHLNKRQFYFLMSGSYKCSALFDGKNPVNIIRVFFHTF